MKPIEKVQEILDKYDLDVHIPEKYATVYKYRIAEPEKCEKEFCSSEITDRTLFEKYEKYIPKGWYGFSIGDPTPPNWYKCLDEVLEYLTKEDPEFEIHQIKTKFGGIRFYVESQNIEHIWDICALIERAMYDRKLIY